MNSKKRVCTVFAAAAVVLCRLFAGAGAASAAVGDINTIAGTGTAGFSGDGGPATAAQLNVPIGVVKDAAGNIYIADMGNNRIRKISPSGIITTIAGNGAFAYSGDDGPATSASLKSPYAVAVDTAGNVYIADTFNHRIRKVDTSGVITTVAGNGTGGVFSGDGGPATSATIWAPYGLTVDSAGNIYIADTGNSVIRKVDTSGVITSLITPSSYGIPYDVAVDSSGNVYFSDAWNTHTVYKRTTGGSVSAVAGNGTGGYSGDGGPATSASLFTPTGIAVDLAGNILIADNGNNRIRKVDTTGTITTIAGNGTSGYSGDGGPATSASLKGPFKVAFGSVLLTDTDNARLRNLIDSAPSAPEIRLICADVEGKFFTGTFVECGGNLKLLVRQTTVNYYYNIVRIKNVGSADLEITGVNILGTDAARFGIDTNNTSCSAGTIISPGGLSCRITVEISESNITNALRTAALCITSNDAEESTICLDLWAGKAPAAAPIAASSNSTISSQTAIDTGTLSGLPPDFTPDCAVVFTATGVNGDADIGISCDAIGSSSKAYKKLADGSYKEIYPASECSGITGASMDAGLMLFKITDNSDCDLNLATGTIDDPIVIGTPPSVGSMLNLVAGWNLFGNGVNAPMDVATAFSNAANVLTVWKWVAASGNWAFYTPQLADGGAAYAASKGYDALTSIGGGEGFWVNANTAFATQLPTGAPVAAGSFQAMPSGWNLIAIGYDRTPSDFNLALGVTPPAPGDIPINVLTLWAWDATLSNWYFYAPSLQLNGTLLAYIASKNYLGFGTNTLGPTVGFWVNRP